MKNNFPILLLILLFIGAKVVSQPTYLKGHVITLKGDTLKGEIKNNPKKEIDLFTKVYFRTSETDKKTFNPDKIKEYSINGMQFLSKKVDGEHTFFRVLSTGGITLYEWQYEWQTPTNDVVIKSEYFMEKKDDKEPVKIKQGNKFKKQLVDAMSDNQDLSKELDSKKYEYENMLEIFQRYNAWYADQGKG